MRAVFFPQLFYRVLKDWVKEGFPIPLPFSRAELPFVFTLKTLPCPPDVYHLVMPVQVFRLQGEHLGPAPLPSRPCSLASRQR